MSNVCDGLRFVRTVEELLGRGYPVRFRVGGWSMRPAIQNGEMITVAPLGRTPIRSGDVLLYRRGGAAIVHRVVEVRSSSRFIELKLRGDAADFCDPPIVLSQVLGRVMAVERAGCTRRLDRLSDRWSRLITRAIRRARVARSKIAALVEHRAQPSS